MDATPTRSASRYDETPIAYGLLAIVLLTPIMGLVAHLHLHGQTLLTQVLVGFGYASFTVVSFLILAGLTAEAIRRYRALQISMRRAALAREREGQMSHTGLTAA